MFSTVWMCEAYVIMWVWIWWVLLWCGCIELVYNGTVWFCIFLYVWVCVCGFCTVWMREAYVLMWVWIWWVFVMVWLY